MIKKMWKKLVATVMVTAIVTCMMVAPAAARGVVHNKNDCVVLKTTWVYSNSNPKKKVTKVKKGQVYQVKKVWQAVTYKVGKKTYKGYVDRKPANGVYVRKTPNGKKIVKISRKGKTRVTGKWAQITIKGKTSLVNKESLKAPISPFNNSDYFFAKKVVRDNSQTAGSSYRVWVTDFWGDTYKVSPWGYDLVE